MLVRALDEYRFGLRTFTPDELVDLAFAWSVVNHGQTPAEVVARLERSGKNGC